MMALKYKKALTDDELLELINNDDLDDYLPVDNSQDTDIESDEEQTIEINNDRFARMQENANEAVDGHSEDQNDEMAEAEDSTEDSTDNEQEPASEPERKWYKKNKETSIPDYVHPEGINDAEFTSCHTACDVFLKVLGKSIEQITFQSNLYATQKGRNLRLTEKELLVFIGINFLSGYHQLPSIAHYWSTAEDLRVPIVAESMTRNRFQEILANLHCNDNSLLGANNKDKLFKVRPLIETLNLQFSLLYYGTRALSVDESIVRFKGRSTIKQYNPMKPIKRGYKLWCLADQDGFVKKFDVYQGKNGQLDAKYAQWNLGEKIVLFLLDEELRKNRIVYFDNFFTSIKLLEKLKLENTLGCGTIRSNRLGTPRDLSIDKKLKRGDFDYRISNTNISYFKWKDNRIVTLASNFHGNEATDVQRKNKDGSAIKVSAPTIITDYNTNMGGVDHHDQLRSAYCIDRKAKKWWHRLLWGFLDIAFVNSYVIAKHLEMDSCQSLLIFRRDITLGLIKMSEKNTKKRSSSSREGPVAKKRRFNASVPTSIRLGNLGNHWVRFETRRGRCEMCSFKHIQSKPHSSCSTCGVFLCVNEKKNCFSEYHEIN